MVAAKLFIVLMVSQTSSNAQKRNVVLAERKNQVEGSERVERIADVNFKSAWIRCSKSVNLVCRVEGRRKFSQLQGQKNKAVK